MTSAHLTKPQVWTAAVSGAAVILTVAAITTARPVSAAAWVIVAVSFWIITGVLNRQDPIPMPYYMRWLMFVPRGPHSPAHLASVLRPKPGERLLELGPGPGVHALPIAQALLPGGVLNVLDMQPEMLRHLARRCRRAGLTNVTASLGNARALPYADHVFDAAYMIAVLGEIANQEMAIRELRRVLKPNARLVIGEVIVDPDYVSLQAIIDLAKAASFDFQEVRGPRMSYFALFTPAIDLAQAQVPNPTRRTGHPPDDGLRFWGIIRRFGRVSLQQQGSQFGCKW